MQLMNATLQACLQAMYEPPQDPSALGRSMMNARKRDALGTSLLVCAVHWRGCSLTKEGRLVIATATGQVGTMAICGSEC